MPRVDTPLTEILGSVRNDVSQELIDAFNDRARDSGAKHGEVMWALVQLQARVIGQAQLGDEQMWVAARFHEMLQVAFPGVLLAIEKGRRMAEGRPAHDA